MDKMLATTVYDEKLKSWIVYVGVEGELLPVGRTINGGLERFVYCKFNTRGKAIDWIKSKPNKLKYDKDLIVYCKFNTNGKAIDWIKSKPNKLKYDKDLIVE